MERKRGFMKDDVWERILHEYIVPYKHVNSDRCPPTFIPHKDGEPLLNNSLQSRLNDIARSVPDMKIDIYSHGLMLPRLAKQGRDFMQFLATLPNRVRYMMSYHPYNHDNTENDYTNVVQYMQEILKNPPPNVEFITVSHKSKWVSEEMQQAWKRTWEGLPITVHCNAAINPWTGLIESDLKFNGCPYADFGHWFFGATGNVIVCCLDLEEEIVLGNVMKDSPKEMFEKTYHFYEMQRKVTAAKGRPLHAVCDDCYGFKRRDRVADLLQLGAK